MVGPNVGTLMATYIIFLLFIFYIVWAVRVLLTASCFQKKFAGLLSEKQIWGMKNVNYPGFIKPGLF